MTLRICATKKLLDRIKPSVILSGDAPNAVLGNWYATALFWKPQLTLFVHEETLLPVLMPLAPASSLAERFPAHLAEVLMALDVDAGFVAAQVETLDEVQYAKFQGNTLVYKQCRYQVASRKHRMGCANCRMSQGRILSQRLRYLGVHQLHWKALGRVFCR
jgi:hypothetical protein